MAQRGSDLTRVRVAALIVLDGRVVLVRHRAGQSTYHLLPGGGVDYRETLAEALTREVAEETGLQIEVGRPLFISDTIDPQGPRHVVNITFASRVTGGTLLTGPVDARVEAVDLVDPSALSSLDLRPPVADSIPRYLAQPDDAPAEYLGPLFTPEPGSATPGMQAEGTREGGGPATTEG